LVHRLQINYITFFKDYFESSLPLIFTAVLFAWGGYSYFQMADHQLIETSKPLIKLIQSGLKILKKPKKLIFLPFLAILPVLFTFALLLLFLARFGHYILLGVFTLATSEGLEKAYYLDVDQVKLFFLIVFLSVIVVDLFLFFRPHKFHLRKIIIRMLAFCISVSLICGTQTLIHDLSRKPSRLYVNENNETKKNIFYERNRKRTYLF
jgi:hypothetical protein